MKMTEKECREFKIPYFDSLDELTKFIKELDDLNNDYGTATYAMSLAGTAAFNYIAHKFGCTGFQASCADLDMLRRIRLIDGPFMISKLDDVLYPQYNLMNKMDEFINSKDSKKYLKEKAKENLKKNDKNAHPDVIKHWKQLSK